jgi:hypothetical protein
MRVEKKRNQSPNKVSLSKPRRVLRIFREYNL